MKRSALQMIAVVLMCLSLAACGALPQPEAGTAVGEKIAREPEDGEKSQPEEDISAGDDAPEQYDTDTLTWEFSADTGTLSLHGEGVMRSYLDSDPEWEQHRDAVTVITLEDGITSVGACAFDDYPVLTEVRLPDSIERIDDFAFYYDWSLRTVTVPGSLEYVGQYAFYNTLLWEPEDLVFPEGCEYIGDYAFHSALKTGGTVSLPSTLRYLGEGAFTNAVISDFTVAEGNGAYISRDHAILTGDGRELMMVAPFAQGVTEYAVPEGVERIWPECFNLIQEIQRVYIPASVTEIPEGAFFSTFALREIVVDEANGSYRSENGLLLTKDGTVLLAWPDGTEGNELVIPEGVECIGEYVFYGRMAGSYSVVLPEGVKALGTMCLPDAMTSLSLPASLETVAPYVFYDGIAVETVRYGGTQADWERITLGEGNDGLAAAAIQMKG